MAHGLQRARWSMAIEPDMNMNEAGDPGGQSGFKGSVTYQRPERLEGDGASKRNGHCFSDLSAVVNRPLFPETNYDRQLWVARRRQQLGTSSQ